jgi:hypothetical protein
MTKRQWIVVCIGVVSAVMAGIVLGIDGSAQSQQKPIGAPCTPRDGWEAAQVADPATVGKNPSGPDIHKVPAGYVDRKNAAPDQRFCLLTPEYPHGYFTANCTESSSCGEGAQCLGDKCRALCTSNSDCKAPTTCVADDEGGSFCRCLDCVPGKKGPTK